GMRGTATDGELRANRDGGGLGVKIKLEPSYSRAAIAATRVMGLEIAGVDMLEGVGGPKILEINSSPGLEGIERASGVDVATAIVKHAERFATRYKGSRKRAMDDHKDALEQERTVVKVRSTRNGKQAYR